MLKDITLGQFFPGDSIAHKLDARCKLLLVVVYIAALFTAKGVAGYGLVILATIAMVAVSRIPPKALFRGLKPVVIIIVFTAILNMFFTTGTPLVKIGPVTITTEGLIRAGAMVLRIMLLICGTFLLTYTTSPIALTDGMERLFNPLKKIKVPVHEMSMMMRRCPCTK